MGRASERREPTLLTRHYLGGISVIWGFSSALRALHCLIPVWSPLMATMMTLRFDSGDGGGKRAGREVSVEFPLRRAVDCGYVTLLYGIVTLWPRTFSMQEPPLIHRAFVLAQLRKQPDD